METKYYIGFDAHFDKKSEAALVVMKVSSQGKEIVKIKRWHDENQWILKLKTKFYLWRITNRFSRYYKKSIICTETNEGIENLTKWATKPRIY